MQYYSMLLNGFGIVLTHSNEKKNEELINARSMILVSLHLHDVDVNQMIYTTCMSASNYNNLEYIIIITCRE